MNIGSTARTIDNVLPMELLENALSFLRPADMRVASQVSRRWRAASTAPLRDACLARGLDPPKDDTSWHALQARCEQIGKRWTAFDLRRNPEFATDPLEDENLPSPFKRCLQSAKDGVNLSNRFHVQLYCIVRVCDFDDPAHDDAELFQARVRTMARVDSSAEGCIHYTRLPGDVVRLNEGPDQTYLCRLVDGSLAFLDMATQKVSPPFRIPMVYTASIKELLVAGAGRWVVVLLKSGDLMVWDMGLSRTHSFRPS